MQQKITLVTVGIIVAVVSFVVANNLWAARGDALADWLNLDDATTMKMEQADPTFDADSQALKAKLSIERQQLSKIMTDPASTDQQILSQVEQVIAAHDALERRVAQHLVAVRSMLTPQQQKRLMSLCATAVESGSQHRWRRGQTDDTDDNTGRGNGQGQGQGRHGPGWNQ